MFVITISMSLMASLGSKSIPYYFAEDTTACSVVLYTGRLLSRRVDCTRVDNPQLEIKDHLNFDCINQALWKHGWIWMVNLWRSSSSNWWLSGFELSLRLLLLMVFFKFSRSGKWHRTLPEAPAIFSTIDISITLFLFNYAFALLLLHYYLAKLLLALWAPLL